MDVRLEQGRKHLMATLRIRNLTTDPVYLSDFYSTVQPGKTLEVQRSATDLPSMRGLQRAIVAQQVALSVDYSEDEMASGALASGTSVEAGDIAPVPDVFPVSGLVCIHLKAPPGNGDGPDDVEIFPVGGLPFKFRLLDLTFYIVNPAVGAFVELLTQPNRLGTLLAEQSALGTGRFNPLALTRVVDTDGDAGLYVHRSNSGVGFEIVAFVRPEL